MDVATDGGEEFASMRAIMKELKYLARATNAAIMGTAIHAEIERALADNPDVLVEVEAEYNGMKAHIDCFVPGTGDVT